MKTRIETGVWERGRAHTRRRRLHAGSAPPSELLFVLLVRAGLRMGLTHGRDRIVDNAPAQARLNETILRI